MTRFNWSYPSEGTKCARTLEQAFGPYARGPVHEPDQPMPTADKIVVVAGIITAAVLIVFALIGWL